MIEKIYDNVHEFVNDIQKTSLPYFGDGTYTHVTNECETINVSTVWNSDDTSYILKEHFSNEYPDSLKEEMKGEYQVLSQSADKDGSIIEIIKRQPRSDDERRQIIKRETISKERAFTRETRAMCERIEGKNERLTICKTGG